MPTVSHSRREVLLKIVYYGPGLGGKTTNLQHIHNRSNPNYRGKLITLATETERTLFFDLLPVDLGAFKGYRIRLHLCTVPGQIFYDRTRQLILKNVDGVVFVVDSQPQALEPNVDSIANLYTNLELQGSDPDRLPLVVQFNKRDLPGVLPTDELRSALGIPDDVLTVEASAREGRGVFETLKAIVKGCLNLVGDPAAAQEGRSPSIMPGARPSMFPEGRAPAARTSPRPPASGSAGALSRVPKAPPVPRISSTDDGWD